MDFRGRKKIEALRQLLRESEEEFDKLDRKVTELKAKLQGTRVCGGYCQMCKHGFRAEVPQYNGIGWNNPWKCLLDCKCKDFEQK